jgi:hypothetical protein
MCLQQTGFVDRELHGASGSGVIVGFYENIATGLTGIRAGTYS